ERTNGTGNFIAIDSFIYTDSSIELSLINGDSVRFKIKTTCGFFYSDTTLFDLCNNPDSFTINTSPLAINEGDSGFFHVSILGCGNSSGMETEWYQWRISYNQGNSWSNIPDSNNDT